jgi:hypothetical protein
MCFTETTDLIIFITCHDYTSYYSPSLGLSKLKHHVIWQVLGNVSQKYSPLFSGLTWRWTQHAPQILMTTNQPTKCHIPKDHSLYLHSLPWKPKICFVFFILPTCLKMETKIINCEMLSSHKLNITYCHKLTAVWINIENKGCTIMNISTVNSTGTITSTHTNEYFSSSRSKTSQNNLCILRLH